MKKSLYILLCLCLPVQWAVAQIPTVLTLAPDARSSGMADLGVATPADVNAQHFNVAKYAFMGKEKGGLSLSYSPWMRKISPDMNNLYLAGFVSLGKNSLSASVSYFSVGEIVLSDGNTAITRSPSEWAVDLGYSRRFSPYFSLGMAFRYVSAVYADLDLLSVAAAGAFAADLGGYFQYPFANNSRLSAGLSFTNIGTKLKVAANTTEFLPMSLQLGVHYEMDVAQQHTFGFGLQTNKSLVPENNPEASTFAGLFDSFGDPMSALTFGLGAEYNWNHFLMLRAGYYYNSPEHGDRSRLSFGAGLSFSGLTFDAAYWLPLSSGNSALDNTYHLTLSYMFR